MVDIPEPLADPDEATHARTLAQARWGGPPACDRCGSPTWQMKRRPRTFACTRCPRRRSVTAGTLFHRARLPLRTVRIVAWLLFRREPFSARAIARTLGLREETVWQWCHRLRAAAGQLTSSLSGFLVIQTVRVRIQPPTRHAAPVPQGLPYATWLRFTARRSTELTFVTDRDERPLQIASDRLFEEIRERCATTAHPLWFSWPLQGAQGRAVRAFRHLVGVVAKGVSGRWVERYAVQACHLETPLPVVLARAMAGPVVRFSDLRPGGSRLDEGYGLRLDRVRAKRSSWDSTPFTVSTR